MKQILIAILIFFGSITVYAKSPIIPPKGFNPEPYVNAIYKAEGGERARYLYGIVSVKYDSPNEAREICTRTVVNNYNRWQKAGSQGEFLQFLANVYCPIGAKNDPKGLNKNWYKNVKYFLNK